MKIYCSCCDKVQPVRVDDCLDAKTLENAVGAAYKTGWEHGKAVEREACAKLCDEIAIDMWNLYKGRPPYKGDEKGRASDFTQGRSAGADDCAEAIRKRSST
jgi:hypothetical protein